MPVRQFKKFHAKLGSSRFPDSPKTGMTGKTELSSDSRSTLAQVQQTSGNQ